MSLFYGVKKRQAAMVSISNDIERMAKEAELPTDIWLPVLESVRGGAPKDEVQKAIRDMQSEVQKHLEMPS